MRIQLVEGRTGNDGVIYDALGGDCLDIPRAWSDRGFYSMADSTYFICHQFMLV